MEAASILLELAVWQDIGVLLKKAPQIGQMRDIFGVHGRETWQQANTCQSQAVREPKRACTILRVNEKYLAWHEL